jgi:hypothetical protein
MTEAMATALIFLDVDGVLNAHEEDPEALCGQIHRDKVERLNRVLRETGARIVLSSAWRYIIHRGEANLAGMEWLFRSHGLIAGRLAGYTRKDTMERQVYNGEPRDWPVCNERGAQITEWLAINGESFGGPPRHVVLDDLDLGISEAGHPFVHTDGTVGLTEADADRAIALLTT